MKIQGSIRQANPAVVRSRVASDLPSLRIARALALHDAGLEQNARTSRIGDVLSAGCPGPRRRELDLGPFCDQHFICRLARR
jgi:hypothetical protein